MCEKKGSESAVAREDRKKKKVFRFLFLPVFPEGKKCIFSAQTSFAGDDPSCYFFPPLFLWCVQSRVAVGGGQ